MKITSKSNRPIKSFRSENYNKVITVILYFIPLFSILFISNIEGKIYYKIMMILIILFIVIWLYWFINIEIEIYDTRFSICFNLIFLPFKIVIIEILFDKIDWIDGYRMKGEFGRHRVDEFILKFNLKNGKQKKYTFYGKYRDFIDLMYNWKKIAKYKKNDNKY